jgi:hypothetical protein
MVKMINFFYLAVSFFWLSACATHQNYINPVQQDLKTGQCASALPKLQKLVEKNDDEELLYLMEYGSALQICKDFKESSKVFIQADRLAEQQDYVSLSRSLGATLLNEQLIQYKGDKFEKLFINALAALNYLELNDLDSAMVEVRRINEKTKKFAEAEKRNFEMNPFANYLGGLVYELQRKFDDACISYKEAHNLDPSYRAVAMDMLTSCWRAKRTQEFNILVKQISATPDEISYAKRKEKDAQEVVLIYLQGWGPKKTVRNGDVAFPLLQPTQSQTQKIIVSAEEETSNLIQISQPIYSVEKAAIYTLEEDYKTLGLRRFGARIAKEVVADQIRQKDRVLGDLAWIVMVASERADLRNWALLPESVQVVRLNAKNVKALKITGKDFNNDLSEDLGRIDLQSDPQKRVYLIRSLH